MDRQLRNIGECSIYLYLLAQPGGICLRRGGHNDLVHQPGWDISECISGLGRADGCQWGDVEQAAECASCGSLGWGGAVLEETRFDMGGGVFFREGWTEWCELAAAGSREWRCTALSALEDALWRTLPAHGSTARGRWTRLVCVVTLVGWVDVV